MMKTTTMILTLAALFVFGAPVEAQTLPVKVGDKVRVTAPDVRRRKGTVLLLTTDSLVMRPEYSAWPVSLAYVAPKYAAYRAPNRLAIPLASVTRLELSTPGGSRAGQGAFIGLALGGIGGAVAAGTSCASSAFFEDAAGTCAIAGFVIVGAGGALVGAIVGAMITGARWEEVPLERFRLQVGPQREGRFGLGLSVRL